MTRALLIDGGQSGCRIAVARDGEVEHVASMPGLRRVGRRYDGLRALVAAHEVDVVAAGLTGYAGEELAWDAPRVLVTNDAVTAYLGALGDEPGAVIVAGTGAIALAAGADGWARADGWGTLLGDDGGGHWIGRRALAMAARAADGRAGGSPELLRLARARYGDDLIRGDLRRAGPDGGDRRVHARRRGGRAGGREGGRGDLGGRRARARANRGGGARASGHGGACRVMVRRVVRRRRPHSRSLPCGAHAARSRRATPRAARRRARRGGAARGGHDVVRIPR